MVNGTLTDGLLAPFADGIEDISEMFVIDPTLLRPFVQPQKTVTVAAIEEVQDMPPYVAIQSECAQRVCHLYTAVRQFRVSW